MSKTYSPYEAKQRLKALGFSAQEIANADKNGCCPTELCGKIERLIDVGYLDEATAREEYVAANSDMFFQIAADAMVVADSSDIELQRDKNGRVVSTIDNFVEIMLRDPFYSGVFFNEMKSAAEVHQRDCADMPIRAWSDTDEAESRRHIEHEYGIHDVAKHEAAKLILFKHRAYNPLKDLVESTEWDGVNRCEHFLTKWMKAADDAYTHEVSRLIFAGGINRLYSPGCKYDDVPVLIGRQGSGKSTIISFLALNDAYCTATKNMSGDQKSIEVLQGAWIVEIPELAAFKNADIESLKAFVTRQTDKVRFAYARNTSVLPRRCIFVGNTNNREFLVDKTGNRRFYPVTVNSDGYEIFTREIEIRDYISQCWAEALVRYRAGTMYPYADRALIAEYQKRQAEAMESDWREGVIAQFLERKRPGELTCTKEVYDRCVKGDSFKELTMKESREIGQIIDNLPEWERSGGAVIGCYGKQRCWRKLSLGAGAS